MANDDLVFAISVTGVKKPLNDSGNLIPIGVDEAVNQVGGGNIINNIDLSTMTGFSNKSADYLPSYKLISIEGKQKFIHIKHTGKIYQHDGLGDDTQNQLNVLVDGTAIAKLSPKESMILPRCNANNITFQTSGEDIAIEYLTVNI